MSAGKQMGGGDQCEGIRVAEQRFGLRGVVEDLDSGKTDADFTAEELIAELGRLPAFAFVREDGEAGDRATVAVV